MSWSIGLIIGNYFSEASGRLQDGTVVSSRWAHSPGQWYNGFQSFVCQQTWPTDTRIQVRCPQLTGLEVDTDSFSGAFLTTSGFEHWLQLGHVQIPFSQERVFGIQERSNSQGLSQVEITPSDLEFLAAKFEMMKTENVAIGYLHSDRNPKNEEQTAQYFRDKKLGSVQTSHSLSKGRWFQATAQVAALYFRKQVEENLNKGTLPVEYFDLGPSAWSELFELARVELKLPAVSTIVDLSPETWMVVSAKQEGGVRVFELTVGPTHELTSGPFGQCCFGKARTWQLGPMLTGRGRVPLVLDLLYSHSLFEPGQISIAASPRGGPRIQDSLRLLESDPKAVRMNSSPADRALEILADSIEADLIEANALGPIVLLGPLASGLFRLLKGRPGLGRLQVHDNAFLLSTLLSRSSRGRSAE